MRWTLQLQEYDFEVHYKPGVHNTDADAISRLTQLPPQEEHEEESDGKMKWNGRGTYKGPVGAPEGYPVA